MNNDKEVSRRRFARQISRISPTRIAPLKPTRLNIKTAQLYRVMILTALISLVVFALWDSVHETFSLWRIDADSVNLALLYHGLIAHGITFLTTWRYTQDNWLLSLGPIMFMVYALFGINKYTIIGPGWAILVINAILGSILLYKLAGRKSLFTPLIFILVSLLVGLGSLGTHGFMAYLMSHNSTMSYVLVSTVLIAYAIETDTKISIYLAIALAIVVSIASLSDPWFDAAFGVPAVLALVLTAYSNRRNTKVYIALASTLAGLAIAHSQFFGVMGFLPKAGFVPASSWHQFRDNIYYYVSSICTYLNGYEVLSLNKYFAVLYLALSAYLVGTAAHWLAKNVHSLKEYGKFIVSFSVLSMCTISAAFVLSDFPRGYYSARFLDNVFYLGLVLVVFALSCLAKSSPVLQVLSFTWLLVYCASSIYSSYPDWGVAGLQSCSSNVNGLISFLKKHGLHYGYGGYWAADANAISVLSKQRVVIRPVSYEPVADRGKVFQDFPFSYIVGNHPESSPYWYNSRYTRLLRKSFLVIAHGGGTPELDANSIRYSEKVAVGQFGKPDATYVVDKKTILVWNKPLAVSATGAPVKSLLEQFCALQTAASCFLRKGGRLAALTPRAAEKMGCLSAAYGGFSAAAPNDNWTKMGGWLGAFGHGIGVGVVVGGRREAGAIIRRFGRSAQTIYFPYPRIWNPSRSAAHSVPAQVLLMFKRS